MSKDAIDTLKAVGFLVLAFAAATLVALFVLEFWATFGKSLPFIADLPAYRPENTVQMLAFTRPLGIIAAGFLVAAGLALALRSPYFDHMLQIFAKAVALVAASYIGIVAGHWAYLRMTRTGDISFERLTGLLIMFVILTAIAMFMRIESLRAIGWMRYVVVLLLILLGPLLLVTGP